MSKPTVVILAAGASSRFFPFNSFHKGYNTLGGRALISHTIHDLLNQDFTNIVVVVGETDPEASELKRLLDRDGITHPIKIAIQSHPSGAAGAIQAARSFVSGPFVITSPYYTRSGVWADELWSIYQENNSQGVLLVSQVANPSLYGMLKHEGDKVVEIVEKPDAQQAPSKLRVRSIYLFHPDLFTYLDSEPESEFAFEAAYSRMAKDNFITFKEIYDSDITLKYAWHLLDLHHILLQKLTTSIDHSAQIADTAILDDSEGAIIIEKDAVIKDFVKISGPCYIGKNTLIGEYSFIRVASIESGAVVGANSEIARSIIMPEATLHSSYVADSIIGQSAKLGAGLITANKRFDNREVLTEIKGKKVNSHREKLGLIVGERTQLGVGIKSMPGTIVASDEILEPGIVIKGTIKK